MTLHTTYGAPTSRNRRPQNVRSTSGRPRCECTSTKPVIRKNTSRVKCSSINDAPAATLVGAFTVAVACTAMTHAKVRIRTMSICQR